MAINYKINMTCGLFGHRRYICILCFIGLTICYVMRFVIALAITEMVAKIPGKTDPDACPTEKSSGGTEAPGKESKKLKWTEMDQGLVLSSFFWGYVCTQVPGGLLADRMGPRQLLIFSCLLTSVFTLATPICAMKGGVWACIVIRICVGLAQGCFYASLHTVVARWVPTQERGLWGTLVFSGAQAGNMVQSGLNGILLDVLRPDWDYVFYIWAVIGIIWSVLCFFTTWDSYTDAPDVSPEEEAIMAAYYEKVSKKAKVEFTPWKAIAKSGPVWAIIFGMIGHDWGLFALVVDIPKYMKSVLRFDVKSNGLYVALGYLCLVLLAYIFGAVVDWIEKHQKMSITWNRILFTSIASVGPSIGLLACSYSKCNRVLAVIWLVFGMATMGTFYPSLKVNQIDLSPNHAGVIGALSHTIGAISGILVPYLVGVMTPESTWSQWNYFWWLTFIVMSVTNVIYLFFASGEVQSWNTEGLGEAK